MASRRVQDRPFGTEFGLRVILHACKRLTKGQASKFDIRITGLSASLRFWRGAYSERIGWGRNPEPSSMPH